MHRGRALLFLCLGLAVPLFGLFDYFAGFPGWTPERLVGECVAGGILLKVGVWLDRSPRRPPRPGNPSPFPRSPDAA
jgi:hypothetical protein